MTQLEGSGASRLLQMFGGDKTQPTTITTAIIQSVSPILVRVDGDSIDTPEQGIIMADSVVAKLQVGVRVIVAITNDGQLVYVLDKAVI
ncbi:hypothetical protein [Lysinibacillus sp. TE18511]